MMERKEKILPLDAVDGLTLLGTNETDYRYDDPAEKMLETFPNAFPDADYFIRYEFPEFTSLCPKTGQPDFAKIFIEYIPNHLCLETKSIKLYFFAFRNFGAFMESITNKILRDMVRACNPKQFRIRATFNPRGAVGLEVDAAFNETNGFFFAPKGEVL